MAGWRFLDTLGRDVRYGFAQWRRSPGLAVVIVLSLALGIGANTALFTVVNAAMLPKIGVAHPEQLVAFGRVYSQKRLPEEIVRSNSGRGTKDDAGRSVGLSFPYPYLDYLRAHSRTLAGVAGFAGLGMFSRASAIIDREPMFIDGDMVTGDYFKTLGVVPLLGRAIAAADEDDAAPRVAVLSHGFWTRVFGASPSVLGKTIAINRVPVTIVGVAPRGFAGLETGRSPDVWMPITLQATLTPWGVPYKNPGTLLRRPNYWWMQIVGRLRPGVTQAQAQAEAEGLLRTSFAGSVPDSLLKSVPPVSAVPATRAFNRLRTQLSKPLLILAVVVALVLLVACANVATLLLARATARRREMSVRLAMGASRGRLLRQLLTEQALYSGAGAVLGLIVAALGSRLVLALFASGPEPVPIEPAIDWTVLGFTAGIAVLTTFLFGLMPAARATRVQVASDLKDTGGGSAHELRIGRMRLGRLFVAAQIALTLPLVIGAGLFLRTLANLENERLGFNSQNLLIFSLDAGKAGFTDERVLTTYRDMREAIEAVPGVKGATFSELSLVSGWVSNGQVTVEDQRLEDGKRMAYVNSVGPAFFRTMAMRLVLGRALDERDVEGSPKVAVVNETMARRFFGPASPVGRRFWPDPHGGAREEPITVVGVVADAKYDSLRNAPPPTYFRAYAQDAHGTSCFFEIRTEGPPTAALGRIREIANRAVPGVPLGNVTTQAAQIAESLSQERMFASLFSFFGLTALVLACIGLQGTMAYTLRRRTREIGIRMALGAGRASVLGMALRETLVIAIAGLILGGALAAGGARFVRSLVFGVTPLNPATIAAGVALMLAVTVAAGFVPARRAARIDPMRALRDE